VKSANDDLVQASRAMAASGLRCFELVTIASVNLASERGGGLTRVMDAQVGRSSVEFGAGASDIL